MIENIGGNKEKRISAPINKVLQGLAVIIFSVLIFCIYIHKNVDILYAADDNILQWGPVIRKVFDRIFAGEGIPYWDFYQYKGFDIFSSGYYGQLNPFMYFAYAVSRYIFSYKVETLTVYMITMFSLGNLMMYIILTDFGIKLPTKIISILTYSTSAIFFMYAFYYFTFNNYFFIPFLLWIIIYTRNNRMQWAVPGIILAFSLLLGHVQYSCYYVMLYCIIQVVFCVQDRKPIRLLSTLTSILTFAVLSCFIILLSLSISENRESASEGVHFFGDNMALNDILQPICGLIFRSVQLERSELKIYIGLGIFGIVNIIFLYNPIKRAIVSAISYIKSNGIRKKKLQENIDNLSGEKNFYSMSISPKIKMTFNITVLILDIFYIVLRFAGFFESNFGMIAGIIPSKLIAVVITIPIGVIVYLKRVKIQSVFDRIEKKEKYFVIILIACFIAVNLSVRIQNFFVLLYALLIVYYMYICIKKGESEKFTFKEKTVHALLFGAVFFVNFSTGENALSQLLYHIPVINRFRYLYKCSYIYIPVLIFTGAFAIDKLRLKKNWYRTLVSVSVVLSLVSAMGIVYIYDSGLHKYINNDFHDYLYYREIESDINKQLEDFDIDKNYRFVVVGGNAATSSIMCTYAFTKNYGVVYDIFTLNGYDSTFSLKNFEQSNMLMNEIFAEGQMSNLVEDLKKFEDYQKSEESIKLFENQMINNGIRYVLLLEDDPEVEYFVSLIDKCPNLEIVRTEHWYKRLSLMEISGVKSVCTYGDNIKIPAATAIDEIGFETSFREPTEITIFETYEPHYKLYLTDSDGTVSEAEVTENSDGYVTAVIPSGNYTAEFRYENIVMNMAVVMACVSFLLTIISVVAVCISKKKFQN